MATKKTAELTVQQRTWRFRENAVEISLIRQALQARRVRAALDETPEDKIRRLEQENYWLRRLREEQAGAQD